jgi:hypothetical protein
MRRASQARENDQWRLVFLNVQTAAPEAGTQSAGN